MTYVSTNDKMPRTPHWAIITFSSIYIEGDERSRTNPGHGYPAHSKDVVEYQAFTDEAEWKAKVEDLTRSTYAKPFLAAHVVPATVTTTVKVDIK